MPLRPCGHEDLPPHPSVTHQLFLVSKARRVAELIQCLAKGLYPGHKPLGCQHPGGAAKLILCFLYKPWGFIQGSGLWMSGVVEPCRPWDLSYTAATQPCSWELVTNATSSSASGHLALILGNLRQWSFDGRQHLGAMGRDLVLPCRPTRESKALGLLWGKLSAV